MKELGNDIGLKVARSGTAAAAQVVKRSWKRNAPVAEEPYKVDGQLIQPGNIGRNVISKRLSKGDTKLTSEHIVTVKHKGSGVTGKPYRAAIFKEFGTVKMAADPWARPAYENSKEEALEAMVSRIRVRVDKAAKGGK